MIKLSRLTAALLLFGSVGCGSISVVSNSLVVPSDAHVELGDIVFDYASFRQQDGEWQQQMREQEATWRTALQQAYTSTARELGLDRGAGESVALRVTVTDLNPGSRAARFWVGAGNGSLDATIDAGDNGGMVTRGAVTGSNTLVDVFAELGEVIAEQIAESRR